jgi:hypothetical protein
VTVFALTTTVCACHPPKQTDSTHDGKDGVAHNPRRQRTNWPGGVPRTQQTYHNKVDRGGGSKITRPQTACRH